MADLTSEERGRVIVRTSVIGIVANVLRETIDDILGHRPDADLATGIKRTARNKLFLDPGRPLP